MTPDEQAEVSRLRQLVMGEESESEPPKPRSTVMRLSLDHIVVPLDHYVTLVAVAADVEKGRLVPASEADRAAVLEEMRPAIAKALSEGLDRIRTEIMEDLSRRQPSGDRMQLLSPEEARAEADRDSTAQG
jgi:hypothetical protein